MENIHTLDVTERAVLEVVMQALREEIEAELVLRSDEANEQGQYTYTLQGVTVLIAQQPVQVDITFLASLDDAALPKIATESLSIARSRAEG